MSNFQPWGLLLGRILLAYIFLMQGYGKIGGFAGTAKYMASKGMPLIEPLLVATIIVEIGAGLLLAVGWKARWAAWALFLFVIPTTLIFHAYWTVPPEQVFAQTIQFQKNLAIMGGMLYVALMGPGRLSLDKA
jgi:putative oxidoreductase